MLARKQRSQNPKAEASLPHSTVACPHVARKCRRRGRRHGDGFARRKDRWAWLWSQNPPIHNRKSQIQNPQSSRLRLPRPQASHQDLSGRLPGNPAGDSRELRGPDLRRPAVLPLQRRHHLPRRAHGRASTRATGTARAGPDANHEFNRAWLAACQRVLKPNGTIWVSGTAHIIHSVGFAMQQLGFKLLNDISWVKPNPAAQPLLPLLHPRHRNHHLGGEEQEEPAHVQLQADEATRRRQADEKRLDDSRPRPRRESASANTPRRNPSPCSNASSWPHRTRRSCPRPVHGQRDDGHCRAATSEGGCGPGDERGVHRPGARQDVPGTVRGPCSRPVG